MSGTGTLAGKLALVTGAGIGIGQGVADELARQGAAVVLHYAHSAVGAERTAREIAARGGRAATVAGDLASVETCQRVVDEAVAFLGGLDILVNNSGITERAGILDVTPEQFDRVFQINFRSQYFCAQRAIPRLVERGGGSILNMTSIHAFGGVPGYSVYAATKGAIASFTRELAIELTERRIRVNAVAPGHVEVPRHLANPNYTRAYGEGIVPWGRVGEPADIGRTVAFLVSDAADFITGQVLYVDGGTTAKLSINPAPLPGR
jgi:glucose 1-dehydrogenase/3-oxoacyl-[acyl-carrier protein] reductase